MLSLAYFWLQSDSELIFAGDSGGTEASDGSERSGLELAVFWELNSNWVLDLTVLSSTANLSQWMLSSIIFPTHMDASSAWV